MLTVAGLLSILAANWVLTGRAASSLGLASPTSTLDFALLGLSAVILTAFGVMVLFHVKIEPGSKAAAALETLPKSLPEVRLFALSAFVLGFGWEVLYRGYLLFALKPVTGTAAAITLASIAYGISHGEKTVRQFVASVLMAFAFTAAYAATGGLWWLILLHTGLPLVAAAESWKRISATALPPGAEG